MSSAGGVSSTSLAKPLLLDSFFPFDPYTLRESSGHVKDFYRVYQGAVVGEGEDESSDEEDEEEMEVQQEGDSESEEDEDNHPARDRPHKRRRLSSSSSAKNSLVSSLLYGTSPGFKC